MPLPGSMTSSNGSILKFLTSEIIASAIETNWVVILVEYNTAFFTILNGSTIPCFAKSSTSPVRALNPKSLFLKSSITIFSYEQLGLN